jgi:adenylosuccinate synthase
MGYGDEGKGSIVDYLTDLTGSKLTVRFNGGPQASHCVYGPKGPHSFSQFGAGTFAGAQTFLANTCLVEPYAIIKESEALTLDWAEHIIFSGLSVIITPFHWMANRLREQARGEGRHGSCGRGVGEARRQQLNGLSLLVGLARTESGIRWRLREIEEELSISLFQDGIEVGDEWHQQFKGIDDLASFYYRFFSMAKIANDESFLRRQEGMVIFEGAQGILLDQLYGEEPHRTWTDCTFGMAEDLCSQANLDLYRMGVIRTYHTRHGAGPLPNEWPFVPIVNPSEANQANPWQGEFRAAPFSRELFYKAIDIDRPDGLAVNCVDVEPYPRAIRDESNLVVIEGRGPKRYQKRLRGNGYSWNQFVQFITTARNQPEAAQCV